jgi:hypothetical protein
MSVVRHSKYTENWLIDAIVDEARRDVLSEELATIERALSRAFECANRRSCSLLEAIRNFLTELAKNVLILSIPEIGWCLCWKKTLVVVPEMVGGRRFPL